MFIVVGGGRVGDQIVAGQVGVAGDGTELPVIAISYIDPLGGNGIAARLARLGDAGHSIQSVVAINGQKIIRGDRRA